MKPFILQDWITIKSSGKPPAPQGPYFVQDAAGWLDLEHFQDVVIWFDLRQTTQPGVGGTLTWHFQSAPTKDDAFFSSGSPPVSMATSSPFGTIPTRVVSVIPATLGGAFAGGTQPLARWLRWMIVPSADSPWTATFRVIVAANQVTMGNMAAGRSTALASAMGQTPRFDVVKPSSKPSSVVSIEQTMTPISMQGPSPQSVSVVQPSLGNFGGLGSKLGA